LKSILSFSSTSSRAGSKTKPAGEPRILVGFSRYQFQIELLKQAKYKERKRMNRVFALRKAIKV